MNAEYRGPAARGRAGYFGSLAFLCLLATAVCSGCGLLLAPLLQSQWPEPRGRFEESRINGIHPGPDYYIFESERYRIPVPRGFRSGKGFLAPDAWLKDEVIDVDDYTIERATFFAQGRPRVSISIFTLDATEAARRTGLPDLIAGVRDFQGKAAGEDPIPISAGKSEVRGRPARYANYRTWLPPKAVDYGPFARELAEPGRSSVWLARHCVVELSRTVHLSILVENFYSPRNMESWNNKLPAGDADSLCDEDLVDGFEVTGELAR